MDEVEFSGCEPNYCYQRDVTYSATLQQIVALIDASEECRQFIKVMRFLLFTYSRFGEEAANTHLGIQVRLAPPTCPVAAAQPHLSVSCHSQWRLRNVIYF